MISLLLKVASDTLLLKAASHTSSADTSQIITSPVRYVSPHAQNPPLHSVPEWRQIQSTNKMSQRQVTLVTIWKHVLTFSAHRTWDVVHCLYLVENVIALPVRGHLQQLVQTLGRHVNQNVPAAVVVALAGQAHHLIVAQKQSTNRLIFFSSNIITLFNYTLKQLTVQKQSLKPTVMCFINLIQWWGYTGKDVTPHDIVSKVTII